MAENHVAGQADPVAADDVVRTTAAPMTRGWHADRAPDRPAIVLAASGEVVTYAKC
ncbi:hypothetical protein [Nocardia pseudovaccinii]|uniref:hypothetical protein n=1 Tax=Nocardia pseudovaccinii TaxID=189540 RepID=UPI000AD645E6|nr:hypothetical protein [Nocardia pseudovaccinii]